MIDLVTFLDNKPRCPQGHEVTLFNGQDLDPEFNRYFILDQVLYTGEGDRTLFEKTVIETMTITPHGLTGGITLKAICPQCRREYAKNHNHERWEGEMIGSSPLLEVQIEFVGGEISAMAVISSRQR